ncbi:NlpC/P60 family protein [Lentibacillus amyloliquefaciens]|uniref:Cell wall lytic activity n=1 Tax=Lentibacillus amyloliquefaciens TaxID=1472767 RepID=A0A0U3WDR3_9BACI|nr:NlpC/P60 family protein [Lentibacillus amyloliquefaciens]ALX47919.1 cell wall lytic activity [Lentibacillus amyloliquefaciens]
MLNGSIEHAVKQSVLYTCVLSQPFVFAEAYPALQNNQLLAEEQLQYGHHVETVRILQQKLNKLSFFDDDIDGNYGLLTEHALKKFQAENDLKITGQADLKSLNVMIDEEMQQNIEDLDDMSGSIYPGMEKSDVKIIQRVLDYFGYYKGEIDGLYGPLTQRALEEAEDEYDMELIDDEALKALYEQNRPMQKNNKEAANQNPGRSTKKDSSHEPGQAEVTTSNHAKAIDAARAQIGTPYVWGGDSPGGFDCSGFIQYIFKADGISLPRTVSDTWNYTTQVGSPSVGDLVFFETYKPGPSHMGIYIGDGKFIHASESSGVETSKLSQSYWKNRYLGAGRVQ